ncbi:MAG TPA: competence/damage-inducible protein A [Bacteroidales bacterium]|nr:competence/damage-inducible protein A [Bacteroidales bacterium]
MVQSNIRAEVLTIGDEILIGQVVNTNAAWMAQQMNLAGFSVVHMSTVPDDASVIKAAIDLAFSRAGIVLMTGGLGPTKDDITKNTLTEYFNTRLVVNKEALNHVEAFFAARGVALTETNYKQAEVPESCKVLKNSYGTAPGMLFEKDDKILVSMPGVPLEMKHLMTEEVIPYLSVRLKGQEIIHKTIMTHGMGESHLSDRIKDWEEGLPVHIKLAYLPRPGVVRLRLSAAGDDRKSLQDEIDKQAENLHRIIPELIFGYEDESLEKAVGKLLKEKRLTVSTAESCTGGAIATRITSVPGCSEYFKGAVVAYDNHVKESVLDVADKDLQSQGAVSQLVVEKMASGARQLLKTDFAIATSGIAGPDGGTEDKPVGTVWIAVASGKEVRSKKFRFGNNRERNIERSVLSALNMLRVMISED